MALILLAIPSACSIRFRTKDYIILTYWIENYIGCLIMSVLLAGLIIPKIMLIAFRKQLFDEVDERKIHRGVVPRLGGIAFMPSFIFSFCMVTGYAIRMGNPGVLALFGTDVLQIFYLLCALMLMYLVGMADDLIGVRYRAKFIFQIISGALLVISGIWLHDLYGLFNVYTLNYWVGWGLTILLVIYIINAINLIDGIDGLASGLSAIALIFYGYVFYHTGQYIYFLLSGATLGTLIPFFYYNVFGNAEKHKKIFMGDTGALTIGTILGFFSLIVASSPSSFKTDSHNLLVIAYAPLLLPCFDVLRVFIHRIRQGKNPFLPDKCHIHHKLLALGLKQWQALVFIILTDALFIVFNMVFSSMIAPTWLFVIDILIWTFFNVALTLMIRMRERHLNVRLYE